MPAIAGRMRMPPATVNGQHIANRQPRNHARATRTRGAHQPQRQAGEQHEKVERRLKSRERVLDGERRGEGQSRPRAPRRADSAAPSRATGSRTENQRRQRVEERVHDDLQVRIPLPVEDEHASAPAGG